MSLSFTNLTRHNEIGANCYYLDLNGQGFILDAGMHPKLEGWAALPDFGLIRNKSIDSIFLTHAHHDHIGGLPILMQQHPETPTFMGDATYSLGDMLLHNSVNVMKRQRQESGVQEYPLYTHQDVTQITQRWQACHLNTLWSIKGFPSNRDEETLFQFHHAGHILGSVAVEIQHRGHHILYTGDINLSDQTVMSKARLPHRGIDTRVIETTRGAHSTPTDYSRQAIIKRLIESINRTFERGGAVMIPVFAMGKTQEALTILHLAQQSGHLPHCPIYIGGLGNAFSQVYDKIWDPIQRRHPFISLKEKARPEILDGKKMARLKLKRGNIYLISSGMMTKNTLSNRLAQQMLARENDSIFFIGYADPDLGRKLRATPRGQQVTLNEEFGKQPVLCNVDFFDLTAHALREDILAYIQKLEPKHCILVHGDFAASEWFQTQLKTSHPQMKVTIPEPGKEIEL